MKNFKVIYTYPLGHPIMVVIKKWGKLGLLGWLFQKYGKNVTEEDLIISERIVEIPTLNQWMGSVFQKPEGDVLEVGHTASSVSLELASMGFNVSAIDLREYPFTHPNLNSITGDFLQKSFDQKFDFIISLSVIEHFGFSKRYGGEDEIDNHLDEDAFEKMAKLLKSTGHVVVSMPYAKSYIKGIWFRVYTRNDLEKKLGKQFTIIEKRYYKRNNNKWTPAIDYKEDPKYPYDGVAMFFLKPKITTD